jgi:hypothetical protein
MFLKADTDMQSTSSSTSIPNPTDTLTWLSDQSFAQHTSRHTGFTSIGALTEDVTGLVKYTTFFKKRRSINNYICIFSDVTHW